MLAATEGDEVAFTVVTFVVVFLADGAGFFTDFLVDAADFLVAMNIPSFNLEYESSITQLPTILLTVYSGTNGTIFTAEERTERVAAANSG